MAVKSMEMVEEATTSMEMAPGALPSPGRVPEQRLLSPEIHRWQRRGCRTSSQKTPTDLGFFVGWLYIGEEAASEVGQGHLTIGPRGPGGATLGWGCPLAPLRLLFGPRPSSRKNRSFSLCFVQFREYFLCSFSETKNSRKHGTGTVASR
jgi:hypothetical protein